MTEPKRFATRFAGRTVRCSFTLGVVEGLVVGYTVRDLIAVMLPSSFGAAPFVRPAWEIQFTETFPVPNDAMIFMAEMDGIVVVLPDEVPGAVPQEETKEDTQPYVPDFKLAEEAVTEIAVGEGEPSPQGSWGRCYLCDAPGVVANSGEVSVCERCRRTHLVDRS